MRAMTGDQAFRVIVATTRDTARGAAAVQNASGAPASRLGELMTGAVLLREAMSPGHRLQIVLRDADGGTVVADSLPDGATRGLVNPGSYAALEVGVAARLQVARTLANGELHQGIVEVPEGGHISTALMRYLQESEQVFSVAAVGALLGDDDRIAHAGGYLVQLLPGTEAADLETMTDKLADLPALDDMLRDAAHDADALLERVLDGTPHTRLGDAGVRFGCNCSRERFIAGLATIERSELVDIVSAGKPLEIRCEACGRRYEIDVRELEPLTR